ncbi:MAG: DUF2235 domain-containing protein [Methylococcales bacterium]|nr:DUF2235 domain-containing protein [Methylococcales bacterium]
MSKGKQMKIISLLLACTIMYGCSTTPKTIDYLTPFSEACETINSPDDSYNDVNKVWKAINDYYNKEEYKGKRKLVVFMDGTGNTKVDKTNVWKLYKLSLQQACTGASPVIPYYDKGVGAKFFDFVTGGFSGSGASLNIRQAYRFLVQSYNKGDEVFIFGFSRGAFTARSLNGMLYYVGLLKRDGIESAWYDFMPFITTLHSTVGDLYKSYHIHDDGTPYFLKDTLPNSISKAKESLGNVNITTPPPFMVKAIGVFDTVPALGLFWDAEPDNHRLGLYAHKGVHAISLDEQRKAFQLLRFNNTDTGWGLSAPKEVFFPGVHSNVGGGYNLKNGLSKLSLDWMISQFSTYRVFPDNMASYSCESLGLPCEAGELKDEFFKSKKLRLQHRWPKDGDYIHESVFCRQLLNLPSGVSHPIREKNGKYETINLKKRSIYSIESYKCAP